MWSVILLLRILSECNITSKIETKHWALNVKSLEYPKTFSRLKLLCHEEEDKVEPYLVNFLRLLSA